MSSDLATGKARKAGCWGARCTGRGFTLVEAMVTVAILAIVATVALPAYSDYITRSRLTDAYTTLNGLSLGLEQYYQDNRSYASACGTTGVAALPGASTYFTFACPTLTATTYSITATGNTGTVVAGFTFTLNQAGTRATTAVPTGWTSSTTCWINGKGGKCL